MKRLDYKAKRRVKFLEQEQYEVLYEAQMALMKDTKTGKYVVVDAAGTVWQVKK